MNRSTATVGVSPKKSGGSRTRELLFPYALIAPSLVLFLLVMTLPLVDIFKLSLHNYSLTHLSEQAFVGLGNFRHILFEDPVFWATLPITLKWVVAEVALQLILGMALALLLNQSFRGRGLARSIMFVPWAVSGVLTTMLWLLIFNQHIGLLNALLRSLGIANAETAWLANPKTVFGSVVVAELWRGIPFFAITLLAALQTIPPEMYESSAIDGCGPIRRLFSITMPFLREAIVFSTLMRAIWEFNNIDLIFTMTGGGPVYMTTTLPIYMMRTAVLNGDFGYGSALAVVIFFVLLLFAVVYLGMNKFGRSIDD